MKYLLIDLQVKDFHVLMLFVVMQSHTKDMAVFFR
jgi:hypothetical protein